MPNFFKVVMGILLVVCATTPRSAESAVQVAPEKIGTDVWAQLQQNGSARIVIALDNAPLAGNRPEDLAQLRSSVEAAQQSVLADVAPTDFRITHQFQAVSALSGLVYTEKALEAIAANPAVLKVDLDVGGTGSLANTVPLIGANLRHAAGITGTGVVVAVLDSGVDLTHQDFAGKIINQACFADGDGTTNGVGRCPNGSDQQIGGNAAADDAGHGTHVTGIIASQGVRSSVGVAPGVKIVAVRVTYGPSFSGAFASFSAVIAGLDYLINNRPDVKIINMSLGTTLLLNGNCDNTYSWTMAGANAINTLRTRGTISFASAGNDGSSTQMTAPACIKNVVSVGATTNGDVITYFSNANAFTDILAPGNNVLSDAIGNGTTSASGTSMASPHAAGCAALLVQSGEAVTPEQIENRLKLSSVKVTNPANGITFSRIDCRAFKKIILPRISK